MAQAALGTGRNLNTFVVSSPFAGNSYYPAPEIRTPLGFAGSSATSTDSIFDTHTTAGAMIRSLHLGAGGGQASFTITSHDGTVEYGRWLTPTVVGFQQLSDFPIPAGGWRLNIVGSGAGTITIVYEVL